MVPDVPDVRDKTAVGLAGKKPNQKRVWLFFIWPKATGGRLYATYATSGTLQSLNIFRPINNNGANTEGHRGRIAPTTSDA